MRPETTKRLVHTLGYVVGGVTIVGGVLDAGSNAFSLPASIRVVLLGVSVLLWASAEYYSARGLPWRTSSGVNAISFVVAARHRLGLAAIVVLFGITLIPFRRVEGSLAVHSVNVGADAPTAEKPVDASESNDAVKSVVRVDGGRKSTGNGRVGADTGSCELRFSTLTPTPPYPRFANLKCPGLRAGTGRVIISATIGYASNIGAWRASLSVQGGSTHDVSGAASTVATVAIDENVSIAKPGAFALRLTLTGDLDDKGLQPYMYGTFAIAVD